MLDLMIIRPVEIKDLNALVELSMSAKWGLTSLPKDKSKIKDKILLSRSSFIKNIHSPKREYYMFVMEYIPTGKIVGTCSINAKSGHDQPLFVFRRSTEKIYSKQLGLNRDLSSLNLMQIKTEPSELGSLFLSSDFRKSGLGRMLSLSRFLFMATHLHRFDTTVIARMRGISNSIGQAPFWDFIGRRLTGIDYIEANKLCSENSKFLWDMLPKIPICEELLPIALDQVIGKTHENTLPALRLLMREGFNKTNWIDILDGGPIISSDLFSIRSIHDSQPCVFARDLETYDKDTTQLMMVSCGKLDDFRLCCGPVRFLTHREIAITKNMRKMLNLTKDTQLRVTPLYPSDMDDMMSESLNLVQKELSEITVSEARVFSNTVQQTEHKFSKGFLSWHDTVDSTSKTIG